MLFSLSLAHTVLFPFILKAGQLQQHSSRLRTQRRQTQSHPLHHKKRFHSLCWETQHKCPVSGSQQRFLMPVVNRWWSCLSKGSVCWEATASADIVWEAGAALLSPLQFERQDSPTKGFSYRENQLQGAHGTIPTPILEVYLRENGVVKPQKYSQAAVPARLTGWGYLKAETWSVQFFNDSFVVFEGKCGVVSLTGTGCFHVWASLAELAPACCSSATGQDMSLIQELGAIILCLELELSCAMRVHEVVPYDKRWEDFSDLGDPLHSCVLMWSFGPENPAQMTEGMWEVEPEGCR